MRQTQRLEPADGSTLREPTGESGETERGLKLREYIMHVRRLVVCVCVLPDRALPVTEIQKNFENVCVCLPIAQMEGAAHDSSGHRNRNMCI